MPPDAQRTLRRVSWVICLAAALAGCTTKVVPPPEPPISVRRGDEAFRYEEYGKAVDSYRAYLDQVERDEYTARVFYKTALAQYRLGQYKETLRTLDELAQRYPAGHWVQVDALRGDTERAMGDPAAAIQSWDEGWSVGNEADRQKLRQRIVAVARDMDNIDIARARRTVRNPHVAGLLDRQIALRQPPPITEPIPETGEPAPEEVAAAPETEPASAPVGARHAPYEVTEPEEAESAPAEFDEAAADLSMPHDTEAEESDTEPSFTGETKVGVLIPMTGSAEALGERVLRGVRLVFGPESKRVVLKDSGTEPAVATRAFDELTRDPNVVAVIGPVHSDDAAAVAPRAELRHVPLLLLSQRDGLSGRFVLQAGMTRSRQVGTLLDYAMDRARLRRFAVVYPKDATGTDYFAAFKADVDRRGGTVVGTSAYPPGSSSPAVDLATIKKWRNKDNLQAVFLPDNASAAAQFAKLLQHSMPDVPLLGVHSWEGLANHTDGPLNGVLFSDGFYAASARPATREFVEHFQQAYGEIPGVLEAQAHDAALLVKDAMDANANSRADVLRRLQAFGPIDGASGELTVTSDGLEHRLFLLQISGGKLREIGGPAESQPEEMFAAAAEPEVSEPTAPEPETPEVAEVVEQHETPPKGGVEVAAREVEPEPAAAAESTAKIACLLPLTGPDQAYGKRALAGLRLAFADAPEQLLIRDSGGDSTVTTRVLKELHADPSVLAVIGPLRSAEAEIAAPLAERDQLPLLMLSQRDGLAGRYALQVAMTRNQQVRLLVQYAVGTLKLRRIGIVHPNDGYGSAFANTFREEAANHGASVVGTYAYAPGEADFTDAVETAQAWEGLDALFVPDAAPTATAFAAQARQVLPNVALLGTESWNDPSALANAGSEINGAVFADAFFAQSTRPSTRSFVERFERGAGRPPTVFEAQAFDAGMAIRRVLADGVTSRDEVIAQLTSMGSFEGAGALRSSPSGFQRALSILRYRDGKVEEVTDVTAGG